MERRRNLYLTKYICQNCNLFILEKYPPNPNAACRICRRKLIIFDTDGYIFHA